MTENYVPPGYAGADSEALAEEGSTKTTEIVEAAESASTEETVTTAVTTYTPVDQEEKDKALAEFKAAVDSQVEHWIGVPETLVKPRNFIYTAEGAFEVQCKPFANFTQKLEKIVAGTDKKLKPGIEFKHGKIPFKHLIRTRDWFRLAYHAPRKSEALMIIMWDMENEEYIEYVPEQFDGPSHAREIDPTKRPANCCLVAHIHSHPGFGGKFSGIDNGDDRKCSDAAIFGVLGYVDRDWPEMEWRLSVSGIYVPIPNILDIFTSPLNLRDEVEPIDIDWLDRIKDSPVETKTYGGTIPNYHNGGYWDKEAREWKWGLRPQGYNKAAAGAAEDPTIYDPTYTEWM